MSMRQAMPVQGNSFLLQPIGRLFLINALPMAVVMSMSGVLSVVDGIMIGRWLGEGALVAVSLAFPLMMLLAALGILVGGGVASLLARRLGAGDRAGAAQVFAGAHGLVLVISVATMLLGFAFERPLSLLLAGGDAAVGGLLAQYLAVVVIAAPVQLLLGLHADAMRCEGRVGVIALLSVLVNLLNIATNWLGIVMLGWGVAASAAGTMLAQALGLGLLIWLRVRDRRLLPLAALRGGYLWVEWRAVLVLGLPLSLNFVGIALVATVTILALGRVAGTDYAALIAGYGVVTRLLTLAYLPQMAIALAAQTIIGHNFGAGLHERVAQALRSGMVIAFGWCLLVAVTALTAGGALAAWFSMDAAIVASAQHILVPMMLFYAFSGPVLVLALYFQACGKPARTAVLTLTKPWLLAPALIVLGSVAFGVAGIWAAFAISDAGLLLLAIGLGWRIYHSARESGNPPQMRNEK